MPYYNGHLYKHKDEDFYLVRSLVYLQRNELRN